jgi:mRNA interferase MazF
VILSWCCFQIPTCARAKRRPALVLQRDQLETALNQTIVAMVSSNPARGNHPSRVAVCVNSAEGRTSGLRLDSWIMTDNLVTLLETEIDSILGQLQGLESVEAALRHTLGL